MRKEKWLFMITGLIHLFVGVGAIPAGIVFILEPDGSLLGMTVHLLESAPFQTYLLPGIVLLFVIGCGSIIGSFLSFKKLSHAGTFTILTGIVLMIWIVAQVFWIGGGSLLQPIFFLLGAIEVFLGYMIKRA